MLRKLLKTGAHLIALAPRVAAFVAALAMLFAFSVIPAHRFTAHFRTSNAGSRTERHARADQPDNSGVVQAAPAVAPERTAPAAVQIGGANPARTNSMPAIEAPIARLLKRLKLGPRQASSSDPLT
ncbi:MAG: hypothetical protein ACREQI_09425 [Candidatus Binataceae bacterium]